MSDFRESLSAHHGHSDPAVVLGAALREGETWPEPKIRLPLAMLSRHGLVAGATGTGKTRTLQLLTEQLSANGIPVFVADIKGDLSGLAQPGVEESRITTRATSVGFDWKPAGMPVEFVSLTGALGVQLRASVSSFGPLLLSKVLSLNETQTSVLTLVFKYCDDQELPLLDFADLRAVLQYLTSSEGKDSMAAYGGMSSTTVGVLQRKMIELESQGADRFFGEPEFDVHDLMTVTPGGRGVVTALELSDIPDKPMLFSTFMMWLLAELYQNLPEAGDLARPKLVFFFDEAHLLFRDASRTFLNQIEQVIRLIRSKGVGVFFVTHTPKDLPDEVLAQLGNRIQHSLRAHTPDDEKALKATVRTFPKTPFYDLRETLTSLGIGEAVVTVLDTRGVPTPAVAVRLIPPVSRMAPLTPEELAADIGESALAAEYGQVIDRESARELLASRMARAIPPPDAAPRPRVAKSAGDKMLGSLSSSIGRTVGREVIRGLFGLLGARPPRTTRRRSRW